MYILLIAEVVVTAVAVWKAVTFRGVIASGRGRGTKPYRRQVETRC